MILPIWLMVAVAVMVCVSIGATIYALGKLRPHVREDVANLRGEVERLKRVVARLEDRLDVLESPAAPPNDAIKAKAT